MASSGIYQAGNVLTTELIDANLSVDLAICFYNALLVRGWLMASINDGLALKGSIFDGLDDWPRSASRKEWFRITRELVASTIADMDLDPAALAEVEEAFVGAGLL